MTKYVKKPSKATVFIDDDGNHIQARLYEDGAVRDDRGQLLKPHPKSNLITRETSHIYRARAIQARQEAAADGIAAKISQGFGLNTLLGTVEAWGLGVGLVAEGLFSDTYRDRVDALNILSKVTPSLPEKNAPAPQNSTIDEVRGLIGDLAGFVKAINEQKNDKTGENQAIDGLIVE